MKIVAISDTHGRHHALRLPMGDLLIHAGDVSSRGKEEEVVDFLNWFAAQPHRHKVFIAGNHDFYFERKAPHLVKALIPEGIHYLQNNGVEIEGMYIWGSPFTPWFYDWAFNKHRGAELLGIWRAIPEGVDILITHGPPQGILDLTVDGRSVGDVDLMQRILQMPPRVHLFGHIHEGWGTLSRHGVRFYNASVLNEAYQLVNPPHTFQLKEKA